jgi:hypothetical protein
VGVFFNLAESAGLGSLSRGGGRARTPSRFRIEREELQRYVEAGPSAPPWSEGGEDELLADAEPDAAEVPEAEVDDRRA